MESLEKEYERWRTAFGQDMSKRDYFERLLNLEDTGIAVKSVIGYLPRKQFEAT
jgi:hypothetical protein